MSRVGKVLSRYTNGKIPKAFKHIASFEFWEEVLYLTEPEKWTPNAMYQATRLFASRNVKKAQRFYALVLLPRVRNDIRENKRLHFALYQSLKKSLYKPAAFFKGILLPLCKVCKPAATLVFEFYNQCLWWFLVEVYAKNRSSVLPHCHEESWDWADCFSSIYCIFSAILILGLC